MAFWRQDEIDMDENAERIWTNDESLSPILLPLPSPKHVPSHYSSISQLDSDDFEFNNDHQFSDDLLFDSVSQAAASRNHQSTHSNAQVLSSIAESSLSTVSLTLSVKSLNKLNVLVITENDVIPTTSWSEAFYFRNQMKLTLTKMLKNGIEPQFSSGWPHIMRSNSLLMIGDPNANFLLCLPTVCEIVHVNSDFYFINFIIFFQ